MPVAALVILVVWLALVVGARGYLHYRRTGEIAAPRRAERGSAQWWARRVAGIGIALAFAAPLGELAGLAPLPLLDHTAIRYAGIALSLVGIVGVLGAQAAMGDSWLPDVDPAATTRLVTTGPFRLVRNPVLTCMAVTELGLALIVPNVLAAMMLVAFIVSMQIQVRLVEEPYLARVHGKDYRRFAARTGRFLPWLGRLPER